MHTSKKPADGHLPTPQLRTIVDRTGLREKLSQRYENTLRRLGK